MKLSSVSTLDASFTLAVTGAAMLWAPLALLVAAAYFLASAIVEYRNTPPVAK